MDYVVFKQGMCECSFLCNLFDYFFSFVIFTHTHTHTQAIQIRNLLEKFIHEYQQTNVEFVRAIKDCHNQEPSMLSFKKDTIIRVVRNKHLQLAKGMFSFFLCLIQKMVSNSHTHTNNQTIII